MVPASTDRVRVEQEWDPAGYARHGRFVADLGVPVLDLLAPRPGERILDLGCGDGFLTEQIQARGASVVGVDSSAAFVAAARGRGLDARQMSGEALAFDCEFDAVFSNAALHWMLEPDAVLSGVHRALEPGGRFVGEMGGKGNIESIAQTLLALLAERGVDGARVWPWYFPAAEAYAAKLEAAGLTVDRIVLMPRPTPLPGPLGAWLETFAGTLLAPLPVDERRVLIAQAEARLAPVLLRPDGVWVADYVRLRFAARRI